MNILDMLKHPSGEGMGPMMPFLDHLDELRQRIFYMTVAVLLLSILTFSFGVRSASVDWLPFPVLYPFLDPFNSVSAIFFEKIRADLLGKDVLLIAISPFDAMLTQLKISMFLGVLIAMPFIVYHLVAFVGPGLHRKEKLAVLGVVPVATLMFLVGVLFAYYLMAPFTFRFLYAYTGTMGVEKTLSVNDFISFVVLFLGVFGLLFELPVVMTFLSYTGLVRPETWKARWKVVTLLILILAAIITPDGTGVTQMLVAIPLFILYWMGYIASLVAYRRHR